MRVVIVGAGQAGATLAAALRRGGHDGPLTLLGAEPVAPYQRPPLSKAYLLGEIGLDRLMLRGADWYVQNGIELRLGTPVTAIDRAARTVTAGGAILRYDALVLCTGALPRRLPAAAARGLGGLHYLRTLADIDAMAPAFVAGARALVIGGGYIGLEVAAAARRRGLEVTLIEAAPRLLARVACAETADWFAALHRRHGVVIRTGSALDHLAGDRRLTGARLADGTILACDLAIAGIGILPDTALAAAAGLALDDGIAVDAFGRTADPAIWAAGDCAAFPHAGGRLRLESVPNAIDMAEAVAANILGAAQPYRPEPWFWSDQYDVKLQIAGLGAGATRIVIRDTAPARSHWYYRADRLIAADAINDPRAFMTARRLLAASRSPPPAALADPATDLRTLL
jgi:3-phenylpropionate/trans-cinnamate dioxygenase ferredoxin reductase subunit